MTTRRQHTSAATAAPAEAVVARPLWASPTGKARTAAYLASLLPPHHTYVEPFAGSAAVLFAKPRSAVEVVSDLDPEIAQAFRSAAYLTEADRHALCQRDWRGDRGTFDALKKREPTNAIDAFYRFLYTNHFSFLKRRDGFSPNATGKVYAAEKRLASAMPRLSGVTPESGDYERVMRKYDSEDTVFFVDPPYAGCNGGIAESLFDEKRFFDVLKSLRGKFLMTYGSRGQLVKFCDAAGFHSQEQFWQRCHSQSKSISGSPRLPTYLVSNFPLPTLHSAEAVAFDKTLPVLKLDTAERFILGVVLEPDVVDSQDDIYGIAEIRKAAHQFMEHSQTMGHMHRWRVDDKVRIVESYLLPADCQMENLWLRKGTWMLGVHVLDDDLWEAVQRGELTGFSIGGSADRRPLADGVKAAR